MFRWAFPWAAGWQKGRVVPATPSAAPACMLFLRKFLLDVGSMDIVVVQIVMQIKIVDNEKIGKKYGLALPNNKSNPVELFINLTNKSLTKLCYSRQRNSSNRIFYIPGVIVRPKGFL